MPDPAVPDPDLGGYDADLRRYMTHEPERPNPAAPIVDFAGRVGRHYADKLGSYLTAPQDAFTGKLQVSDPETGMPTREAMERGQGVAGMAMVGGMPFAPKGALGMAGGRLAQRRAPEVAGEALEDILKPAAKDAYGGIRGKYSAYGDKYMAVPPPVLTEKLAGGKAGKPIPGEHRPGDPEAEAMREAGTAFWSKGETPETKMFMKDRAKVDKQMDKEGYERYFDPAERSNVDPAGYPAPENMATAAQPKTPETRAKYEAEYDTPEARDRLRQAYKVGQGEPSAVNWYAMRQLHDEFVKHLGPEEGPRQFARKFAGSMAATTGGSDPTSNLLAAAYVNHVHAGGSPFPEAAWQASHPVGGRYLGGNLKMAKKFLDSPEARFGVENPKRSDFQHDFMGHADRATIDEQMSGAIKPGMTQPEWYGPATKMVQDLAREHGVDPMNFQDVAWAGLKKMKVEGKGQTFKYQGPMIEHVNRAIHRTSVLTGKPQKDVVRDWITKDAPLYGLAGSLGGGALLEGEHAREK